MTVRTRFAPSPTGELHLGNARIAVLNWLYARHRDGSFIIRIEDTDLDRNVPGAEDELLAALRRLGLDWQEGPDVGGGHGPYRQSARLEIYRERAEELLRRGQAFHCFCAPEELQARERGGGGGGGRGSHAAGCRDLRPSERAALRERGIVPSIRFAGTGEAIVVHDRVRGAIEFGPDEFDDFVIVKSDGTPTYNFAVVVDDIGMEISHVIRGAGHLSNAPRQLMLYRTFGAPAPEFVHVPHVLAPDGSPLSKRHGARTLREYLDEGYHPDGLINYLSLLSWSSPSGEEVLPRERLIAEVDLSRLGTSDVRLDPGKLQWLSGEHIRLMSPEDLAARLSEHLGERLPAAGPGERVRVAAALRARITTFRAALDYLPQLYPPQPMVWSDEALRALEEDGADEVLRAVATRLEELTDWSGERALAAVRAAGAETGVRGRALYMPVRAALTGTTQGPELLDVFEIHGKHTALRVLREALARRKEA